MAILLAAFLLIAAAQSAAAQQVDLKAQAKELVAKGLQSQVAGKYDDAIGFYKAAYDLLPHPELLFNLGQAHRLKGDRVVALDFYRKYVALQPDGRAAREAREWTAQIERSMREEAAEAARKFEEARLAEEARKAKEAEEAEKQKQAAANAAAAAAEKRRAVAEPAPTQVHSGTREPEGAGRRISWRKIAALGAGAAGVSSLVLSVRYRSRSLDEYDDYKDYSYNADVYDKQIAEGLRAKANDTRSKQTNFTLLGSGLLLTGVALWIFSPPLFYNADTSFTAVRLTPTVDQDSASLVLGGSF